MNNFSLRNLSVKIYVSLSRSSSIEHKKRTPTPRDGPQSAFQSLVFYVSNITLE